MAKDKEDPIEARETKVKLHFPEEIGIELVQANELRHYELFLQLVAVIGPIAAGFWTAFAVDLQQSHSLLWSSIIFTAVTVLFIILAVIYRKKVFHGSVTKSIVLSDFDKK